MLKWWINRPGCNCAGCSLWSFQAGGSISCFLVVRVGCCSLIWCFLGCSPSPETPCALESYAKTCLELGGTELPGAERAARELVEVAPFRESGHLLLMRALAASGNVAEALAAYERLRILLRDELGTDPSEPVQDAYVRLLG